MRAAESNNYKRRWFRRRARCMMRHRFVFVDESGVNTAMTRRYGVRPAAAAGRRDSIVRARLIGR
jgi:hypothetical protein